MYTPSEGSIDKKDNQLNVFKNGYATTITDYVVEYSGKLLESYTNQITENNLNIFYSSYYSPFLSDLSRRCDEKFAQAISHLQSWLFVFAQKQIAV